MVFFTIKLFWKIYYLIILIIKLVLKSLGESYVFCEIQNDFFTWLMNFEKLSIFSQG